MGHPVREPLCKRGMLLGLELDEVLIGGAVPTEEEPARELDLSRLDVWWAPRCQAAREAWQATEDGQREALRDRPGRRPPSPESIAGAQRKARAEEKRRDWWRRVDEVHRRHTPNSPSEAGRKLCRDALARAYDEFVLHWGGP